MKFILFYRRLLVLLNINDVILVQPSLAVYLTCINEQYLCPDSPAGHRLGSEVKN